KKLPPLYKTPGPNRLKKIFSLKRQTKPGLKNFFITTPINAAQGKQQKQIQFLIVSRYFKGNGWGGGAATGKNLYSPGHGQTTWAGIKVVAK
ncbi:hypothetical protein, partial [Lacticaseibacillus paracasei]|uniref:hypothetical protein n=1 Tax=Lacticaseibacillus paracasei TaxID=1597 RepID=UPI002E3401DA